MIAIVRRVIAGAMLVLLASPLHAQSDYGGGWTVNTLDVAASIGQDVITQEMYARNRLAGIAGSRGGSRPSSNTAPANPAPVPPSTAPLPFQSTPASVRSAQAAYLARVAGKDPASAKLLEAEFRRHDVSSIYAGIVRPFGLAADDAADALAAYTILGWLIATGAPDPSLAGVRAVRNQFAGRLAATPALRGADARRALGEELKISFVTLHAGWQTARQQGDLAQYSDGVAALFGKRGVDLRALRLTPSGFAAR